MSAVRPCTDCLSKGACLYSRGPRPLDLPLAGRISEQYPVARLAKAKVIVLTANFAPLSSEGCFSELPHKHQFLNLRHHGLVVDIVVSSNCNPLGLACQRSRPMPRRPWLLLYPQTSQVSQSTSRGSVSSNMRYDVHAKFGRRLRSIVPRRVHPHRWLGVGR